jgi:hypothetical protein
MSNTMDFQRFYGKKKQTNKQKIEGNKRSLCAGTRCAARQIERKNEKNNNK